MSDLQGVINSTMRNSGGNGAKAKRRRWQFTLRGLLGLAAYTALVCAAASYVGWQPIIQCLVAPLAIPAIIAGPTAIVGYFTKSLSVAIIATFLWLCLLGWLLPCLSI